MGSATEWAPTDSSAMLGSTSLVKSISYSPSQIAYGMFDTDSVQTLRLTAAPSSVTAGGAILAQRSDLNQAGWVWDAATRVLRIRHTAANSVTVSQASPDTTPPTAAVTAP